MGKTHSTNATWRSGMLRSFIYLAVGPALFIATDDMGKAEPDQIRGLLQCSAYSGDPNKFPAFDRVVPFTVEHGKLAGERPLLRTGGKEIYAGSIRPDGSIRIFGHPIESRSKFHSEFSGQFNERGDTIVKGRLTTRQGHRDCSISFMDSDQLRIKLGLAPPAPAPSTKASVKIDVVNNNAGAVANENVQAGISDLKKDFAGQVALLQILVKELQDDRQRNADPTALIDLTVQIVEKKLDELEPKARGSAIYQTPIRPNDEQSFATARAVSESYPPIPYYINGTPEHGDFWILPQVSDAGQLQFKIRFIDPLPSADRVRSEVVLSLPEVEQMVDGLRKLYEWSMTAHSNRIRKEFQKRIVCVPSTDCPSDERRVEGKSSTELIFHVNDEGATNGAVQRNKGLYAETYSFSVDSGLVLRCYMRHVIKEAKLEYRAGSQTKEDLNRLFK